MEVSIEENVSGVAEDGDDISKINAMRWDVYKK